MRGLSAARIIHDGGGIPADARCDYREENTGPPDYLPTGPACGAAATHLIIWADGRWSVGCADHLGPFEDPAPPCDIFPLERLT
jgi:hypothetical protein